MVLRKIYNKSSSAQYIWRFLSKLRLNYLLKHNPESIANKVYKSVFNKDIDWNNPTDLIEKIYWLQFNTDTSLWTKCADKYRVREYVEQKGCANILNVLYGKWDNPDDINWDSLPKSFVLKTNDGCGQIIIVEDKNELDISTTTNTMKKWLKQGYGHNGAQLHYTRIKPCIIAEKLLKEDTHTKESLIDYKIWCFNGEPESILVVTNRDGTDRSLSFYDTEWNNISEYALNKNSKAYSGRKVVKPESLDMMLESAIKLSEGISQVRIDFYDINGKAIFGEMTFTTGYGNYSYEYYKYLGSKIDLNKVETIKR